MGQNTIKEFYQRQLKASTITYPKIQKTLTQDEKDARFDNIYKKMDMKADYMELHWLVTDLNAHQDKIRFMQNQRRNKLKKQKVKFQKRYNC